MSKKTFMAVLLCILFASSIVVTVAHAQTAIPTPSVPEFTVTIGDLRAIELTIKNQPFVPYYDNSSGPNVYISLYYNIRAKMHNDENWTNLYQQIEDVPPQSISDYTTLLYPFYAMNEYIIGRTFWELPPSSQVDFQVEAMIGYFHGLVPLPVGPWYFTGETSGWSNTQTVTMPETNTNSSIPTQSPSPSPSLTPSPSPTPSTTPSPTPTVSPIVTPTESPTQTPTIEPSPTPSNTQETFTPILTIIGIVVVIAVVAGALFYLRKTKKQK